MTPAELHSLRWFSQGEYRQDDRPIVWDEACYQTFYWLDRLRDWLASPIVVIRETHRFRKGHGNPWDHTAVDFTMPRIPLGQLFAALSRFPLFSWGLYSGNSAHVDLREWDEKRSILPARWLAVKPDEVPMVEQAGLRHLLAPVTKPGGTWRYLTWSAPETPQALALVCHLADEKR